MISTRWAALITKKNRRRRPVPWTTTDSFYYDGGSGTLDAVGDGLMTSVIKDPGAAANRQSSLYLRLASPPDWRRSPASDRAGTIA
jgi:hypothetical protein